MITKTVAIFISFFMIANASAAESQKHLKYSVLAIKHIGVSNKEIIPIVISDSEEAAEWYRRTVLKRSEFQVTYIHVVNIALLEKLIAEVESFEPTVHNEQKNMPNFPKAVSFTIITPRGRNTFMYDKESAISQLDSLQKYCKGEESLSSRLLYFQKVIPPQPRRSI